MTKRNEQLKNLRFVQSNRPTRNTLCIMIGVVDCQSRWIASLSRSLTPSLHVRLATCLSHHAHAHSLSRCNTPSCISVTIYFLFLFLSFSLSFFIVQPTFIQNCTTGLYKPTIHMNLLFCEFDTISLAS